MDQNLVDHVKRVLEDGSAISPAVRQQLLTRVPDMIGWLEEASVIIDDAIGMHIFDRDYYDSDEEFEQEVEESSYGVLIAGIDALLEEVRRIVTPPTGLS